MKDDRFKGYKSYIMASYVKYFESQGARVVPIVHNETKAVTLEKMKHLNGVIMPGGNGDYEVLGKRVFDEVIRRNEEGQFFPAWGICLGYEFMVNYTSSRGWDTLGHYYIRSQSIPIKFTQNPNTTVFYGQHGAMVKEFERGNFTYNSHKWSVNPDEFKKDKRLADFWNVTSISYMPNNGSNPMPFVASVEAKNYPIFGTQYHPEKPANLFVDRLDINHSWKSIQLSNKFSEMFVRMSRKNANTYGNWS